MNLSDGLVVRSIEFAVQLDENQIDRLLIVDLETLRNRLTKGESITIDTIWRSLGGRHSTGLFFHVHTDNLENACVVAERVRKRLLEFLGGTS